MADIETEEVLKNNCNTVDMQTSSEEINRKQAHEYGCRNKIQNADRNIAGIRNDNSNPLTGH